MNTPRDWWRQLSVPAKGKTEAELLAFKSKLVPAIAPDGTIEDQNALAAAYNTAASTSPAQHAGEAVRRGFCVPIDHFLKGLQSVPFEEVLEIVQKEKIPFAAWCKKELLPTRNSRNFLHIQKPVVASDGKFYEEATLDEELNKNSPTLPSGEPWGVGVSLPKALSALTHTLNGVILPYVPTFNYWCSTAVLRHSLALAREDTNEQLEANAWVHSYGEILKGSIVPWFEPVQPKKALGERAQKKLELKTRPPIDIYALDGTSIWKQRPIDNSTFDDFVYHVVRMDKGDVCFSIDETGCIKLSDFVEDYEKNPNAVIHAIYNRNPSQARLRNLRNNLANSPRAVASPRRRP